ncbi:nuclear transport factor 2 family protein [uncultured Muribaculum sp.]|uniref:nuclear transport factor 2 family protein n=1 Tax=uncultured Muribaculum sp. TaxID=1918613 RepID=UPI002730158B|nr:nuclear transport factor 2 family protein [uncultured Muribaculum sp.]
MRDVIKEYEAVAKAAENFVKSVAEGNSSYAKQLFTDDAVLFGILDGVLEHGSIEQFYRNVDTVGAGDNFKARIDVLAVEETVAVVRVLEEGWGGRIDFTDFLLMLKLNGEWKCVAKAYNQNSDTVRKDSCNAAQETAAASNIDAPEGVVKAIEYYMEGGRKASSEVAKKGFAETATMSWYENGNLQSVPIQVLFDGFDSWQPTEASYKIINCEVADDVAMVAIDSQFGDASYTDMFTLVKDSDGWKIVSKVYHAK